MGYVFIFLGIATLSSLTCRNAAVGMIEQFCPKSCHHRMRYTSLPKWMQKRLGVRKARIPWYLAAELYCSLFFAALGPINLVASAIACFDKTTVGCLIMIHVFLIILECVISVVLSAIYQ